MKEGWKYQKLGEITTSINGLWKGKKEPFIHVGVIRNANFTKDFTLDYTNVEYLDVEEKQYKTRKLQRGDLIVEKSGGSEKQPVGRTIIFDKEEGEFSFSNFTSVLRIKDKESILYTFLYKYMLYVYLRGDTREMQKATTGIHNIEFDKFLSIEIPDIPLSEQQQIVDFLDAEFAKIDKLKNQAEQSLQNANDLFQAALKEMLTPKEGWKEYTIKDVCRIINGYAFPSSAFSTGDANKVIKITNVGVGEFVFDNATVPSEYDSLDQFKVHENDIVIALTRTIISAGLKVCDVPKEYDGALVNQRVAALSANDKCDISFVRYFLRTETAIDYVLKHVNQLMQPNLSINDLKNMPIPMPSIYEQTKIVSRIDILSNKILTLQSNYSRTIQLCADLKQALLRQVFE